MKTAVLVGSLERPGDKKRFRTPGTEALLVVRRASVAAWVLSLLVLGLVPAQAGWSQTPKASGNSSTARQQTRPDGDLQLYSGPRH